MSEHDPHQRAADDAERELEQMQEQSDRLGEDIDETRKDWERKQADPTVPGAGGEPPEELGPPTEAEAEAEPEAEADDE